MLRLACAAARSSGGTRSSPHRNAMRRTASCAFLPLSGNERCRSAWRNDGTRNEPITWMSAAWPFGAAAARRCSTCAALSLFLSFVLLVLFVLLVVVVAVVVLVLLLLVVVVVALVLLPLLDLAGDDDTGALVS